MHRKTTSSGGESNRGYRICPIYPGDVVFGKIAPAVTTHRRNPVVVAKDSQAVISAKIYKQTSAVVNGANLTSHILYYSVNNGSWQQVAMLQKAVNDDIGRAVRRASGPSMVTARERESMLGAQLEPDRPRAGFLGPAFFDT